MNTAKLFPLRIRCVRSTGEPVLDHQVGFAFAGSTLYATNALAIANNVCANLYSPGSKKVPTMEDVADFLARTLRKQLTAAFEVGRGNPLPAVEAAIFGMCPKTTEACTYYFHSKPQGNGLPPSIEYGQAPCEAHDVILLGAHKQELVDDIEHRRRRGGATLEESENAPIEAIRALASDRAVRDVGGQCQVMIASEHRVVLCWRPLDRGVRLEDKYLSAGGDMVGPCHSMLPLYPDFKFE